MKKAENINLVKLIEETQNKEHSLKNLKLNSLSKSIEDTKKQNILLDDIEYKNEIKKDIEIGKINFKNGYLDEFSKTKDKKYDNSKMITIRYDSESVKLESELKEKLNQLGLELNRSKFIKKSLINFLSEVDEEIKNLYKEI